MMGKCNCCNRRDAQVWTNGGPACDLCRDNCRLEPICDYLDTQASAEITSSAADAEPVLLGLEWNAARVVTQDEEAEALRHFRRLP